MAKAKKRGLGKGLSALIAAPDDGPVAAASEPADGGERILELDPHAIEPNPKQPRMHFDEEGLQELAESIKRDGVQEPIIVRRVDERYELVSGERRVRATIMAGLDTVPAICRHVSDADMLKLGLIENIQREDLNPIELARAYQMLVEEFDWTQEQLADEVGKKRATVANTLRLLNLPDDVQRHLAEGAISMGHARALLALPSAHAQSAGCRRIINQGLSVRQAEQLAAPPKPKPQPPAKDPNIVAIEDDLRRCLGTRVSLRTSASKRGKIEIEYYNLDDLERLLGLLRSTR
ncbi:MAG: ParB/RepB/Spo0J family partition protein [Candidatus Hydrogenedentes bacterium]|nr:ParB/RepB/Spo0J family partition protein [Candidatus Hydrogenedentota bacterium]